MGGEIEREIGEPVAAPERILSIVGNMSSPSSPDDDPPKLAGALTDQLMRVAETHQGVVPLHGRLFAQWLHYAFPRECPFPHKTGTAAVKTPSQFGDASIASHEEVQM